MFRRERHLLSGRRVHARRYERCLGRLSSRGELTSSQIQLADELDDDENQIESS
jgi:hypothetical protein